MNSTPASCIGASTFSYVRELVHQYSGVTLDPGKEWLVETRLAPIAEQAGAPSVDALVSGLRIRPFGDAHRRVIDALMTHETLFFRDFFPFEEFKRSLLPKLMEARAPERRLRVWSAACASGQEPYSIAMLIRDGFPALLDWNVQILATDISSDMIARARSGSYNQVEVNRGLPAALLVKHFEKQGNHWVVSERIRDMVELRELNLAKEWPSLPQMDVIFLRNVLIYFDRETKKSILDRLRRLLRPDGYLLLGSAETTLGLDPAFEPIKMERAICYRLREK